MFGVARIFLTDRRVGVWRQFHFAAVGQQGGENLQLIDTRVCGIFMNDSDVQKVFRDQLDSNLDGKKLDTLHINMLEHSP